MMLCSAFLTFITVTISAVTCKHSRWLNIDFGSYKVVVMPVLTDNYMYLLIDKETNLAAAIDPVLPDVIQEALSTENATLTTVLTTHHHRDHADGNKHLIRINENNTKLNIVGGDDRIPGVSTIINKRQVTFNMGTLKIKGLLTPCHTSGHVCYYVGAGPGVVFTGDTLFVGGCGEFFEGDAKQMYDALINTLSKLPDSTAVFCGHEYTKRNIKFGLRVEPHNQDLYSFRNIVRYKRRLKEPTVPSTIGMEKRINPFMRVDKYEVQRFTQTIGNPVKTLRLLRAMTG